MMNVFNSISGDLLNIDFYINAEQSIFQVLLFGLCIIISIRNLYSYVPCDFSSCRL